MNKEQKKRLIESAERESLRFPMFFVDEKNRYCALWELTSLSGMSKNGGIPSKIGLRYRDLKTGESLNYDYKIVKKND